MAYTAIKSIDNKSEPRHKCVITCGRIKFINILMIQIHLVILSDNYYVSIFILFVMFNLVINYGTVFHDSFFKRKISLTSKDRAFSLKVLFCFRHFLKVFYTEKDIWTFVKMVSVYSLLHIILVEVTSI